MGRIVSGQEGKRDTYDRPAGDQRRVLLPLRQETENNPITSHSCAIACSYSFFLFFSLGVGAGGLENWAWL